MKKHTLRLRSAAFLVLGLWLLSACSHFEELEKNPNRPTSVPASLVFNGILNDLYQGPWNDVQRWNQYWASNYNYYANQEYNWTTTDLNFLTLKNVIKMEEEAKKTGTPEVNPYSAMGKFFRAYYFVNMTQRVGDLPLAEALKGIGNTAPQYDEQKAIYKQSLQWLEEANANLTTLIASGTNTIDGDIYLGGDLNKWQRAINTYRLRVLISLSKKADDSELNVKQQFNQILSNPTKYPLMGSLADNVQYAYIETLNNYPLNPNEFGKTALRNNMTAAIITPLRELKDPRLFVFAEPAPAKVAGGLSATNFNAFVGAPSDESLDDMSTKVQAGQYSLINRRKYYGNNLGEPTIQIGYAEQCFNIAEAINLGWVAGDAEAYYKKGIQASLDFYGIHDGANDVYFLKKDGKIGEYDKFTVNFLFDDYYAQPGVQYAGNNADGRKQILTQKYIAFFNNSGWEAFYNHRRTGVPTFHVGGPGTGGGRTTLPMRWQYPFQERNTNTAHYTEAVQRQFGGQDNVDALMWLLK